MENNALQNTTPNFFRVGNKLRGCALVVLLVCGAIFAGFLIGWDAIVAFFTPALTIVGEPVLVFDGNTSLPDVVALTYDGFAEMRQIARINPGRKRIVWKGHSWSSMPHISALKVSSDSVFFVEESTLFSENITDGKERWHTELSDNLATCRECLSIVDDKIILLTQDYYLQVFNAASGKLQWKRRMDGYTKGFVLAGGTVLVIDRTNGSYQLFQLSVEDGSELQSLAPECAEPDASYSEGLDSSSYFQFVPEEGVGPFQGTVYFLYGSSPSCAERWDLASGKMVWQYVAQDGFDPSNDYATLLTPDSLYFAFDNHLWVSGLQNGKSREVIQSPDYEFAPVALVDNTLYLLFRRTRGSEQFGFWGIDARYGEILWELPIKKGAPLYGSRAISGFVDEDQSAFYWYPASAGFRLMMFESQPNQIEFFQIPSSSGKLENDGKLTLPFSDDFYPPPLLLGASEGIAWFECDGQVLGVDILNHTLKYSYP